MVFEEGFDCVMIFYYLNWNYGILGKANAVIKSYPKDRYQIVIANNWQIHSSWGEVNNGVPQ
jgi:hypothetical protein